MVDERFWRAEKKKNKTKKQHQLILFGNERIKSFLERRALSTLLLHELLLECRDSLLILASLHFVSLVFASLQLIQLFLCLELQSTLALLELGLLLRDVEGLRGNLFELRGKIGALRLKPKDNQV